MKKKLPLSFIVLLLISSGAFSQNTKQSNTATLDGSSTTQALSQPSSPHLNKTQDTDNKQSELMLAKTSTDIPGNSHSDDLPTIFPETIKSHQNKIDSSTTQATVFSDEELKAFRELFLQVENAIKDNNDAEYFLLVEQLKDYPLYPYIQYQWLKKHLSEHAKIKAFLAQHKSSRYASRLKQKWLHHLAKHKQWTIFLQFYNNSKDTKLRCHYQQAQFETGNKHVALQGAKKLWAVGYSQPDACNTLFSRLKKSSLFTQNLRWQRFDAALKNNKLSLAVYVKNMMPETYHSSAQTWINLHHNPAQHIPYFLTLAKTEQSSLMFSHAIDRLASSDISAAIKIWDANKQYFTIDKKLANKIEKRLAFKLVFDHEADAYQRFSKLNTTNASSRAWRVRAALSQQNWHNVITAIQALHETERNEETWKYWLARAYLQTAEIEKAQTILTRLSTKRSYYGFLAASRVNSLYQLSDNPVHISTQEITQLKNRKQHRIAYELKVLGRESEAKLQWWHALRQLNKHEIIIAAKLAQQWQWHEIAIFTIAKAKHWDDIELRFPLSFADKINKNAEKHKLNPAILFGLIRRESAFNVKAHSPAGARGLMQIMPKTGRQIARDFNERWYGNSSLYNPVKNLKYGSYYYQKLLTKFDGNHAIALAAYNAGHNRVEKWLPENETVAADIWIETIPFYETRAYVKNVLAYALIYQMRKQHSGLSMSYLAQDVSPLMVSAQ